MENSEEYIRNRKSSLDDLFRAAVRDPSPPNSPVKGQGHEGQGEQKNVVMRRAKGRKRQSKRLSIFSGHEYKLEVRILSINGIKLKSEDITKLYFLYFF